MRRDTIIGLLIVTAAFCIGCSTSTPPEKTSLFNGKDLTGWTFTLADSTVNPKDVWSVKDGVVHCKGVPNGYMQTTKSYSDYKLHVEWRWAEEPTNSGVLLHCQGNEKVWPNCFECQLMAGNAGDFVFIGPNSAVIGDSTYTITEGFAIIPKQHESNEKPAGEWNTYDITVKGSTITAAVNGLVQNTGSEFALTSGPISLQSEGSPIEFRNIWIESLK